MNTKAIRQLADVTLDKYRSSIPRKAFEEFVKDIITGENRATAFRYEASPICRASFPSTLDEDGARCTVEVTVYRLNAVAVTAFLLDGPETLLRHIGLDEREDLGSYVNLFGYNPKYGVSGRRIVGVRYEPQSFSKGLTRPEQTLPARVARR